MTKRLLTIAFAALVFSVPLLSIVNGRPLTNTLKDLRTELQMVYDQRAETQARFDKDYERQHQQMIDVITKSNELSILLYTQEQKMTFDLAYALKKVESEYHDFNMDRRPHDRIVKGLTIEIDRYARLIEALRRLPPVMKEIEVEILPDSLMYHNDSLDMHIMGEVSSLEKEVIRIAIKDSLSAPFVLDLEGEIHRDTCIYYASELLKMLANNRATVIADSTHYQEAYWRMQETYDYAGKRYEELEKYIFIDGQTPYREILKNPGLYWSKTLVDLKGQYDFTELFGSDTTAAQAADTTVVAGETPPKETPDALDNLTSKGTNSFLVFVSVVQLFMLLAFWLVTFILLWLLCRFKKIGEKIPPIQRPIYTILVGTILYFFTFGYFWGGDEYVQMGVKHINTFLWLLLAITASLQQRVKPEQFWNGFRLYTPSFLIALAIILCRNTFVPDRFLVLIFPPILLLAILRQLFFSFRENGKAAPIDSAMGWASLAIYLLAFGLSFFGFTFLAMLILIWWYFQLAAVLSVIWVIDVLGKYKKFRLDKRVEEEREKVSFAVGTDRETLLFGVTWLYDLIREVILPSMVLLSIPLCVHLSLDVFDFEDLYEKIFFEPFVLLQDKEGFETLRISGGSIISLLILFFAIRYLNRAIHAVWQYIRYITFMRKHNRTSVRDNEINLSLGNSIISVLIWMTYVVVVVEVWQIPTGSLTLVAGGLSAGIGLALKDIINNFIYGIQLMGGRLRVGDWIECDGIRGRVTAINYQCVVVETIEGTEMSFLNAALFGRNFNNLTRNNSYEYTKIVVGVAYGTDVQKVRDTLVEAMQAMRTKDRYGREIVDPQYGVYVVVNEMSNSSVDIAVKQYVLVPERIGYIDRAKEVIYKALNAAGITIPFPQCDVHIKEDK